MKKLMIALLMNTLLLSCGNNNADSAKESHAGHGAVNKANGLNDYSDSVNNGLIAEDTMRSSPHRIAMKTINGTHVHIEYGSPGVKDRIIWGGLVGYDKVWVTGAHGATTVQFNKTVEISGKDIPAGTYALFTIPRKDEWVVILNSRFDQHLADEYNEQEDIVRLSIKPVESKMTKRLTYSIMETNQQSAAIIMQWDQLMISIPFKTKG